MFLLLAPNTKMNVNLDTESRDRVNFDLSASISVRTLVFSA